MSETEVSRICAAVVAKFRVAPDDQPFDTAIIRHALAELDQLGAGRLPLAQALGCDMLKHNNMTTKEASVVPLLV